MSTGPIMGNAVPAYQGPVHGFFAPAVPQATIHDQFMMAALTGLVTVNNVSADVLVQMARRIADAAMKARA